MNLAWEMGEGGKQRGGGEGRVYRFTFLHAG